MGFYIKLRKSTYKDVGYSFNMVKRIKEKILDIELSKN